MEFAAVFDDCVLVCRGLLIIVGLKFVGLCWVCMTLLWLGLGVIGVVCWLFGGWLFCWVEFRFTVGGLCL